MPNNVIKHLFKKKSLKKYNRSMSGTKYSWKWHATDILLTINYWLPQEAPYGKIDDTWNLGWITFI